MAFGGVHPFMLKAADGATPHPGGDVVTKSLRLTPSSYLTLSSVTSTPTNAQKCTVSFWMKRWGLGDVWHILGSGTSGANWCHLSIRSNDEFLIDDYSIAVNYQWGWSPKLRDVSAWYHCVLVFDGTLGSVADKYKLHINNVEQPSKFTYGTPATPYNSGFTTSSRYQYWGINSDGSSPVAKEYLADCYIIDGQALTPSSFAEEDATTGQWKPKAYSGSGYGDNGFHLDFKDADAIGNDVSGEGNDFTATNLAASDVVDDTPTDNYCVYNAVFAGATGLSEGNLECTTTARGTFDAMSFASYWEIEANTTSVVGGVISEGGTANTVSVTNGSTFGFRLSAAGALDYTSNGASWTSIATGLSGEQFPYVTGGTTTANFGQSTLSYDVPSGYAVLSTGNLPTPTIKKGVTYFDTKLYDDGAGAKTFDNGTVSMQPDLVWAKSRGSAYDHKLTDSVRGVTKALESNTIDTEATDSTGLTAFGSDGFTVGADTNYSDTTGDGMVAWNWKKSATAGFNIVGWAGDDDGFSGGTQAVAHGLGVAPEMVIAKNRTDEAGGNGNWIVYHKDTSSGDLLKLNSTDGEFTPNETLIGSIGSTNVSFGNDSIDSEYLNSNNDFGSGTPDTYIGYFFASVAGYSKVGSFSGSSTAFIYTGFRPSFILAKRSDWTGGNWLMFDDQREGYNVDNDDLMANSSAVEATTDHIDILSNGFKIRTSDADLNGGTVIYLAVAKNPFKYASAR